MWDRFDRPDQVAGLHPVAEQVRVVDGLAILVSVASWNALVLSVALDVGVDVDVCAYDRLRDADLVCILAAHIDAVAAHVSVLHRGIH